jgi:histidinol-phosphatase (PHP family)
MTRLCTAANAPDVPLEIHLLGLREHRNYPSTQFREIAGALHCSAIFGCGAHSPEAVADPKNLRDAERFAARFGVEPIQEIPFRKPLSLTETAKNGEGAFLLRFAFVRIFRFRRSRT